MEQKAKKVGLQMNLLMGITLSFFLSLTGTLTSGHFTVPGFLLSFLVSTVISIIIGFLVPMKKVNEGLERKMNLTPRSLKAKLIESLVSDFIYTPIMTLCMTALAYMQATKHGGHMPPYPIMFLRSLGISMVVGYVLIFVFMPLYMQLVLKKNGLLGPGGPGGPDGERGPQR